MSTSTSLGRVLLPGPSTSGHGSHAAFQVGTRFLLLFVFPVISSRLLCRPNLFAMSSQKQRPGDQPDVGDGKRRPGLVIWLLVMIMMGRHRLAEEHLPVATLIDRGAAIRVEHVHLPEPSLSPPCLHCQLHAGPTEMCWLARAVFLGCRRGAAPGPTRPGARRRRLRILQGVDAGDLTGRPRASCNKFPLLYYGRRKCRTLDRTRTGEQRTILCREGADSNSSGA